MMLYELIPIHIISLGANSKKLDISGFFGATSFPSPIALSSQEKRELKFRSEGPAGISMQNMENHIVGRNNI